jgi:hypothetical protein
MLSTAAQIATVLTGVLVPAALLISAIQTRLLRQQVAEETNARYIQIYQGLHENMAQRTALFLDHSVYRPLFYDNAEMSDVLDVNIAQTLAEMTMDLLDTTAVQSAALPERLAKPWRDICLTIFESSAYLRTYWMTYRDEYGDALQALLPEPQAPAEAVQEGPDATRAVVITSRQGTEGRCR